jgi:hypothetical protein
MALLTLPSQLNQGVEVVFNTTNRTIELAIAGNLSTDGVLLQALYSFVKDRWRLDNELIKFPIPMIAITGEQFELVNGWDFLDTSSRELVRGGGWALRAVNGDLLEEWMNITSLGLFNDSGVDRAYYLQVAGGIPTAIVRTGEVDQAIQIFGAVDNGNFNYRTFFRIYLREQGKTYGFYDLNQEQNIPTLTNRKFALPLVNTIDVKIAVDDIDIDANSDGVADEDPYSGMSINYYDVAQVREIGGTNYNFNIIIDGNNAPAENIYEFVQWSLRQTININANSGSDAGQTAAVRGETAEELVVFIGDNLQTKQTSLGGVYIDNFRPVDTNRISFTDNIGGVRQFPFIAAGNLVFDTNLLSDPAAKYFVFFTNDDAATVPAGNDFGTANAILINNNSGTPITGFVSSSVDIAPPESIAFDFDYDGNIQRGAGSAGFDAPFTAVAVGATTAQYVIATGTIVRSVANTINFVAALERNYLS